MSAGNDSDPSRRSGQSLEEDTLSPSSPSDHLRPPPPGLSNLPAPPLGTAGSLASSLKPAKPKGHRSPRASPLSKRRVRAHSVGNQQLAHHAPPPPSSPLMDRASLPPANSRSPSGRRILLHDDTLAKAKSRDAQRVNDSMVYLDGPQVYTCAQCRTHLTSHDDIISKSFHGRHGRAYLFDQCVNVSTGPSEERRLITGLHVVCDIFCKRCTTLVGWTYQKAYEASQKYKEGKFIIEKINLHLEESDYYDVAPPAGERSDRWRRRSMSWGDGSGGSSSTATGSGTTSGDASAAPMVFEYRPSSS